MTQKIDRDRTRFRQIVRGKIRENLRKYVSQGEMLGRKGKDLVVPASKIAFVEIGTADAERRIGFGA
jgi:hypothetical protein